MESIFVDIDNDKDLDLFIVSGGNEFNSRSGELADRVYLNSGNGNFVRTHKKIWKITQLVVKQLRQLTMIKTVIWI